MQSAARNLLGLFEISSTTTVVAADEIHSYLASSPSYLCKCCNSTLIKYVSLSEHIRAIKGMATELGTEAGEPVFKYCINEYIL